MHSIATCQQKLFVTSGKYSKAKKSIPIFEYDMETCKWQAYPVATMGPVNRGNSSVIVRTSNVKHVELVIYAGYNAGHFCDMWSYSLLSHAWQKIVQKSELEKRSGHACCYDAKGDTMVLFGGYNGTYFNELVEFSFLTGTWTLLLVANPELNPPGISVLDILAVGSDKIFIAPVR